MSTPSTALFKLAASVMSPADELAFEVRLRGLANEAANRPSGRLERFQHVTADEPRSSREQDHFAGSRSKFCQ